jgi:hypothetical protein
MPSISEESVVPFASGTLFKSTSTPKRKAVPSYGRKGTPTTKGTPSTGSNRKRKATAPLPYIEPVFAMRDLDTKDYDSASLKIHDKLDNHQVWSFNILDSLAQLERKLELDQKADDYKYFIVGYRNNHVTKLKDVNNLIGKNEKGDIYAYPQVP